MKICAKCKYANRVLAVYENELDTVLMVAKQNAEFRAYMDWRCKHPVLKRDKGVNPVSGEHGYYKKSNEALVEWTREARPRCVDINRNGDCGYYKEPESVEKT